MASTFRGRRVARSFLLALTLGAALGSCGQEITGTSSTGGRDALYFADSSGALPPLYLNEAYQGTFTPAGGAGPYSLRVTSGTLPPGLKLSGLNLIGTPSKTGAYKFTVETTDSTLSTKSKEYTLNVNELPPLALTPTLPGGEIRGETRLPVTITAPRGARAARMTWTLPAGATVTRVQPVDAGSLLFWRVTQQAGKGQTVTVDLGFKTVPRSGARVALITVKPARPLTLNATDLKVEALDGSGKVITPVPQAPKPEATPPAAPATAPQTPAPTPSPSPTSPAAPGTTTPPAPTPPTPAPTEPPTPGPVTPPPASPPPAPPSTPTPPGGQL